MHRRIKHYQFFDDHTEMTIGIEMIGTNWLKNSNRFKIIWIIFQAFWEQNLKEVFFVSIKKEETEERNFTLKRKEKDVKPWDNVAT